MSLFLLAESYKNETDSDDSEDEDDNDQIISNNEISVNSENVNSNKIFGGEGRGQVYDDDGYDELTNESHSPPPPTLNCEDAELVEAKRKTVSRGNPNSPKEDEGRLSQSEKFTCPFCLIVLEGNIMLIRHLRITHPGMGSIQEDDTIKNQRRQSDATNEVKVKTLRKPKPVANNGNRKIISRRVFEKRQRIEAMVHQRDNTSSALKSFKDDTSPVTEKTEAINPAYLPQDGSEKVLGAIQKRLVFKCPYCLNTFAQVGDFKEHLRIHKKGKPEANIIKGEKRTGKGKKVRQCRPCRLSFTSITHLQRHMTIHDDASRTRPWKCSQCNSFFMGVVALRIHVREPNPRQETLYPCNTCVKLFRSQSRLTAHVRRVHGKGISKSDLSCPTKYSPNQDMFDQGRNAKTHILNKWTQFGLQPCRVILARCDHEVPNWHSKTVIPTSSGATERDNNRTTYKHPNRNDYIREIFNLVTE